MIDVRVVDDVLEDTPQQLGSRGDRRRVDLSGCGLCSCGRRGTTHANHAVMSMPPVSRFMTVRPVTVDRASTLAVARRLMQSHHIRHLPVVADGRLVGIVTERDLQLLESGASIDPDTTAVERAMTPKPFIVTSDTALDEITEIMAEHKYGSVIVMGRDGIEGIFTAIDACQALTTLLRSAAAQ